MALPSRMLQGLAVIRERDRDREMIRLVCRLIRWCP